MIIRKTLGAVLVASPFVGLGVLIHHIGGLYAVGAVFGGVGLLCAVMFGGVYLLTSEPRT